MGLWKNKERREEGNGLFYTLPVGVVYYDPEGNVLDANPAAERILGIGIDDLKKGDNRGKKWQVFAEDGSDLPFEKRPSRIAFKSGKPVTNTVVGFFHFRSKELRWLNLNAVPEFHSGENKPFRVYVTIADITGDVLSRQKLKKREADYKDLVENMHAGMVIVQDGKISFANKALSVKTGFSIEELEGTDFIGYFAAEERERVRDFYVKRLAGIDVPDNYVSRIVDSKGREIWFDFRVKMFDYDGKPTVLALMNDVDAEVRFEQMLRASESRFRSLFEEAPIGIALVDNNGKPLEVNGQLCEFTGYSCSELLRMSFADFTHPDDIGHDRELFHELLEGKRDQYKLLKRYIHKDGSVKWGELKASLFYDENGNRHVIGMVEDRTEEVKTHEALKIARDKANESSRLKSAFLASISHELRSPLNAVLGFSDIIKATADDDDIRQYSHMIYEAGFKVMTIIDDILELAMSDHGKIRLRPEEYNVGALFDEFFHQLSEVIYKYDKEEMVEERSTIGDELREKAIIADKSKIYQVMVNLIKNAVKFTDTGFVELGCFQPAEESISFYVRDSGIGIAEDQKEVIFDFFRQADGQDHAKYGGIGIGLAISKRVARAMNGDITVDSIPGKGTTFTLTIPIRLDAKT